MAHLLVDDTGIDLRSFDIRMPEHFADRLDRYAIGKGNSGCESVPGNMEGQVFLYAAHVGNLFQIGVHLLVAQDREDALKGLLAFVLLQNR